MQWFLFEGKHADKELEFTLLANVLLLVCVSRSIVALRTAVWRVSLLRAYNVCCGYYRNPQRYIQ